MTDPSEGKAAEKNSDSPTPRVSFVSRLVASARVRAQTVSHEAEKTIADCYAEAEQHGWLSAEAADIEVGKPEQPAPGLPGQQSQPASAKAPIPLAVTKDSPTT